MTEKQFNNDKISLWIKQRLFITRKYKDTMNALEKFIDTMQKSDKISPFETEQQEQSQASEKKLTDDEQRVLNLIQPSLSGEYNIFPC